MLALSSASEAGTLVGQRSWHSRQPAKLALSSASEAAPRDSGGGGGESVAQGGAGFAKPWVPREKRRAREAGERQFAAGCFCRPLRGLAALTIFPGFRKRRFTLGHTLPPASRVEDVETPDGGYAD